MKPNRLRTGRGDSGEPIMKVPAYIIAAVGFAAMTLPTSAYATTVFSQSLAAAPIAQFSLLNGQQEFSQFSLSANTAITGATFDGRSYYGNALPATYVIQFFSSVANLPGTELFSSTVSGTAVSTGVTDNAGGTVQAITVSFPAFNALAGVSYFFGAAAPVGSVYDFVVDSGGAGVGAQTSGGQTNFYALKTAEAFSLSADTPTSAVPEPATWAMMLFGFGGLGFQLRRKRKFAGALQAA